jgi:hypothetical protein
MLAAVLGTLFGAFQASLAVGLLSETLRAVPRQRGLIDVLTALDLMLGLAVLSWQVRFLVAVVRRNRQLTQ